MRTLHTQPARVRFAPSPTGQLHLGGLRTALYNYLLAKKTAGQFLVRIEDTDQSRYVDGAVEKLLSALSWAGIKHDEGPDVDGPCGPYFQSKRTELYRNYAEKLVESGHAYRCFCTPDRLQQVRTLRQKSGNLVAYDKHCSYLSDDEVKEHLDKKLAYTIRLNIPPQGSTEFQDKVHGKIHFSNRVLDDTILIKSDGYPTYHLANVVDDHLMGITHVLRGEEWIASTPKHILLYKALGWKPPHFAHLPLLLNPDRSKLSKRSGDVHVEQYIAKGYLPEAINNFVALLGWHSNTGEEILTMDDMVKSFDLEQVGTSGAVVDHTKLDWINKHHLLKRAETPDGLQSLVTILTPLVQNMFGSRAKKDRLKPEYLTSVVDTIKERIRNIHDIPQLCGYFFVEPDYTSPDALALKKKLKRGAMDTIWSANAREKLETLKSFDVASLRQWLHETAQSNDSHVNHVMMAMRYAVTGTRVGAGVAETMQVLGRETCLERLTASADTRES